MIYIATVSKRGTSHTDWNEDSLYYLQTESTVIGGVFDGCSSGKDSYFASKLFANVFKATIEQAKQAICINNFPTLVNSFFINLHKAINTIGLCREETLSTAILFIYDIETNQLMVKFFGDGVAYSNHNLFEIFKVDEENKPDYIAYSLESILKEADFHRYWQSKKSFLTKTKDFSISTDGIFSFKHVNKLEPNVEIEKYLAHDLFLYKNAAGLKRKLNIIRNKGFEHDDDLTVIRVINE